MHRHPSLHWFYRRPFFWGALLCGGAVALAYHTRAPLSLWAALALGGMALVLGGIALPLTWGERATVGVREAGTLLALAAVFGMLTLRALAPPGDPAFREGAAVTLRGVVERAFKPGPRGRRVLLRAEGRLTPSGWARAEGRLSLWTDAAARAGDRVRVSGRLRRPVPATNPGGFDARLYALRQGVYYELDLRPRGYTSLGRTP
ncbi:MAG TPA: ComEC/Rec2 family competence protein, partial [Armatimonadota bacterium]|nr:ComEC/Rec2 family competence protein [Armatimonadota bacterium]